MQETVSTPTILANAAPYAPISGDLQITTETDPIRLEIAEGIQAYGGSPALFLNNLADNLPGGRRRDETLAKKYPEKFGPDCRRHNPELWNDQQRAAHSERMADVTYGQFYADIAAAIADAAQDSSSGISLENLVALNAARTKGEFSRNPEAYRALLSAAAQEAYAEKFDGNMQEAFAVYLLPVFARLRAMGYTHYDLYQ